MTFRRLSLMCVGVLLAGCTAKDGDDTGASPDDDGGTEENNDEEQQDDDDDDDDDDGSSGNNDDSADDNNDDSPDTDDAGTTGDDSADTGNVFIERPDGGGVAVECDVWAQDCPVGQKCMPWANDGGNAWNATRCTDVDDNPGQVGDDCQVEGSGVSGIDTCDVSSMCYYVDNETNAGLCVGFCEGSQANPVCDPGFVCSIVNDGVLILCRPECDPLLQDCAAEGAACLPAGGSELFTCIIDASGEEGAAGDGCEFLNACDPGLFCADATIIPGCDVATGCCSEFCDLSEADPNSFCSIAGTECVAYHEKGTAPPGYEDVGVCIVPA